MKYLKCLSLLFWNTLLCLPASAQQSKELLEEFAVYPLRSESDTTDDFTDLSFLTEVLKDKRIVLLGEQSHGDGATMEAKVRLVRFLHSQLGFDMLSFESGLYDNYKASQTIKTTLPPKSPLLQSIFPIWSETKEFGPLIAYVHSQATTTTPLMISGFDCQESSLFEETYLSDLKEALGNGAGLSEAETANIEIVVSSGPELLIGSPEDSLLFFKATNKLQKALDRQIEKHSTEHLAMLRQTLISWVALVRLQIDDINEKPVPVQNPRDWQMAQNLIFLSQMHPEKKIICWGASYHFARSTASVTDTKLTTAMIRLLDSTLKDDESATIGLKDAVPMGQLLAGHFGKSLYSIAFSSYEGSFGLLEEVPVSLASLRPPAESIESALINKALTTAFVDFKGRNKETFFYSSAFGNLPIYAQWASMFDGHFFIKTSFPPTAPAGNPTLMEEATAAVKPPVVFKAAANEKRIVDAHTKQGVEYATVYLMNTSRGVQTNADGAFVFAIPDVESTNKVIISSLGYDSDTLPARDFLRRNTLALNPKENQLEAVTIRAGRLSAREIVKRAQKQLKSNYYQGHSQQELFFRTRSLVEDTVRFNEEAAVLVDNPLGFHTGNETARKLTGTLLQFRNTTQNASNYKWGGVGAIWLMYSHNMIIQKSNALHRVAFYNYTHSGVTVLENRQVYKISFECKRPMSFTTGYGYPAPAAASGTLFIDKENFAVLKMEMRVRRKPQVRKNNPNLVTDPWMHYQVETYKEFKGKYFLNSSRQLHYSRFNDLQKNTQVRFLQTMELLSTAINTAPAPPLEWSLLKIKSSLPKEDANFWNVHSFSVEEPGAQLYKLFEQQP